MPIFSRRVLQRLLDETDSLLTREQSAERLRRLNAANEQSLDTEWEVALLYALSRLGHVSYEPDLGGETTPDLLFRSEAIEFVAEIVTVNDAGYEDDNRRIEFERELWKRVRRAGLSSAGFGYRIQGVERDGKTRLLLPKDWNDLFDDNFRNLLKSVKVAPDQPMALHRKGEGMDVIFSYARGPFVSGGYTGYRSSKRETNTPIYNALKRKRGQLKRSRYVGLRGVIVCDGDCQDLRSPERIIRRFFKDQTSVQFVVVVTLSGSRFDRDRHANRLAPRVYVKDDVDAATTNALGQLFVHAVPGVLPEARDDVANALSHLRWKERRVGLSHSGGYEWGGNYMKISSRVLLQLLAGQISPEDFSRVHRFDEGQPSNLFAHALKQGRTISNVTVQRDESEDDDWITLEFTEAPDPAISNFRPPKGD